MIGWPIVLNTKDWTMDAWNSSLKSLNDTVDIAFFGHSIIHFGDWQNYFPEYKVVNLGLSCQDIDGMRKRVEQLSYVHPKYIVVMAGTNTIGLFSMPECQSKYSALLYSIREASPTSRIIVHDVLPVRDDRTGNRKESLNNTDICDFNSFIKQFCVENDFIFLPIAKYYSDSSGQLDVRYTKDGVHITNDSYFLWSSVIRDQISSTNH